MKISRYVCEGSREGGTSEVRHESMLSIMGGGSRSQHRCHYAEDNMVT